MKTKQILLSSLLVFAASGLNAATPGAKTFAISAYDTMKYSVVKIEAHTGDKITIQLRNDGNVPKIAMGHNLVLLKAGADPVAYNATAMIAKAEDYQPKSLASKVIAAIPLLGPKETASVTFTAPAPGTYTYLCSFPAHYQAGMKGVLVVK